MNRRTFVDSLTAACATSTAGRHRVEPAQCLAHARADHLIYATTHLERGMRHIEDLTGITAAYGGSQPGRGTRNALIRLGPTCYLEIRSPDPAQTGTKAQGPFFDRIAEFPRLFRWAVRSDQLEREIRRGDRVGVSLGELRNGERRRQDGSMVTWRMTDPGILLADGVVPFFIDWGNSPHPATDAPAGAILVGLRAEHHAPEAVRSMLRGLDVPLPVLAGAAPKLIATISSSRGTIELS